MHMLMWESCIEGSSGVWENISKTGIGMGWQRIGRGGAKATGDQKRGNLCVLPISSTDRQPRGQSRGQ